MREWVPTIELASFPIEEQEAIWNLNLALSSLNNYLKDFQAALALFDFCESQCQALQERREPIPRNWLMPWQFIAGRDGAMTIFHFGKTIESIKESGFFGCPTLKAKIDHAQLRIGAKLFRQWFRDFERVRHSVAHAAELQKNQESRKRNSMRGASMQNVLVGRNFQNTHGGRILSYEIGQTTMTRLKRTQDQFFAPFKEFDQFSEFYQSPPAP